jgi:hypothetical protein
LGLLALLVAMSRVAFALPGQNTVFSDDITNAQVKSQDIRDRTIRKRDVAIANLFLAEDTTSGAVATNGSGIGAVTAWNGRLEYEDPYLTSSVLGQSDGTCVRTAASGYNFECTWTYRLGGGDTITVSGSLNHQRRFRLAIVGGTGRYRFTSGLLLAHSLDTFPNVYLYELRFTV